jgi:hypothetical protein
MLEELKRFGRKLTLALTTAGTCISLASAQGLAPKEPAPEMTQLAFFVGTFGCHGTSDATAMSGPHPISRTITGRMDLDGFWLFMRFEDKRTTENPMPIRGNWQIIYDAKDKNFTAIWTDNLGRWFPQTSAGWEGDTIAFTGDFVLGEKKGTVRDTFTRVGDKQMVMRVDLKADGTTNGATNGMSNGTWRRFFQLDCRK